MTQYKERRMASNQEPSDTVKAHVQPQRLVFVQTTNNCMFCSEPNGLSFFQYVHLDEKIGYIYCDKCADSVDAAIEYWYTNIAFGKANYLRHRTIQVRRSSGIVESGWEVYNPFIHMNEEGIDKIHCYNKKLNLGRWCILDDILKLNP